MTYDSHGGRGVTDNYHGLGWQAKYGDRGFGAAGDYPKGYVPRRRLIEDPEEEPFLITRMSGTANTEGALSPRLWPTPVAHEDRASKYTLETSYRHAKEGRQYHLAQAARDGRLHPRREEAALRKTWSTPTVTQPKMPTGTLRARMVDGKHNGNTSVPLIEALQREALQEHDARSLPTPNASNGLRGGSQDEHRPGMWQSPDHPEYGELNPEWVEWIMGWPRGWTSPEPMAPGELDRWLSDNLTAEPRRPGAPAGQWLADPSDAPESGVTKTVRAGDKEAEEVREGRIAALGNGQVSAVVAAAWTHLWHLEVPGEEL